MAKFYIEAVDPKAYLAWHNWYAWYPIKIDGKRVWLKHVKRMRAFNFGSQEMVYVYALYKKNEGRLGPDNSMRIL